MENGKAKILIVDSERDARGILQEWLREEGVGCEIYTVGDTGEAMRLFFQKQPQLVITELLIPGSSMNGFTLIERIRDMSDCGVMVLTVLGADDHIARGLELGADEYVVRPVSKRVFLARVRSILRRTAPPEEIPNYYSDDFLTMNFFTHEVSVQGNLLHLRPTEFKLLFCLIQNRERVVPHFEIMNKVWRDRDGSLDSLKWYISSLREKMKLEEEPDTFRHIVTTPRVGYRYMAPEEREDLAKVESNGHYATL